jgi:prepilin-type N-terminal cleavage/methylation domain-containing protein
MINKKFLRVKYLDLGNFIRNLILEIRNFLYFVPRKISGFTLVELMVALGIFGILSSVVITIYFQLVQAANRAAIAAEVEQGASFLMEVMVREIREAECLGGGGDLLLIYSDPNCEGECTTFEKSCHEGICYLTRNGTFLNSDKLTVTNLVFSESIDPSTRKVTVDLTMESTKPAAHSTFKGQFSLHETVALRRY